LERPDSLDDLIPIEEWALDGQPDAGIQPQTSRAVDGAAVAPSSGKR
jgi:hypothetical protein